MSDEAWKRQQKIYAMLERAKGAGLAVADMPLMQAALEKVWARPEPRVFRAYDWSKRSYVYVLAKFWDRRYEDWLHRSGTDKAVTSKGTSPSSSSSPASETTSESTDSP